MLATVSALIHSVISDLRRITTMTFHSPPGRWSSGRFFPAPKLRGEQSTSVFTAKDPEPAVDMWAYSQFKASSETRRNSPAFGFAGRPT